MKQLVRSVGVIAVAFGLVVACGAPREETEETLEEDAGTGGFDESEAGEDLDAGETFQPTWVAAAPLAEGHYVWETIFGDGEWIRYSGGKVTTPSTNGDVVGDFEVDGATAEVTHSYPDRLTTRISRYSLTVENGAKLFQLAAKRVSGTPGTSVGRFEAESVQAVSGVEPIKIVYRFDLEPTGVFLRKAIYGDGTEQILSGDDTATELIFMTFNGSEFVDMADLHHIRK